MRWGEKRGTLVYSYTGAFLKLTIDYYILQQTITSQPKSFHRYDIVPFMIIREAEN